ncbi:HlyD family secretion protein [Roseovarius sp. Pro17]|uniref:HlyD family secretion protein n=1 Tax=Roseovarius sp. Pro17 TaxID=3108175 RepID=UPI002D765B56|nr:HlyD family efflux transporter periplasmic adaptor subunit [Roseovarius sp. Pro17]
MNSKKLFIGAALAAVLAVVGYFAWQKFTPAALPAGIASANGRIEAERIDVATKLPGRVAANLVAEGDMVEAGQLVAQMDAVELQAQLDKGKAMVIQAEQGKLQAEAQLELRRAELDFAELEYSRAATLVERDAVSQDMVDRRRTSRDIAKAAVGAAEAAVAQAGAVISSSQAVVRQLEATLTDADLFAPRGGRVQYRLAQEGEVLPAGGKVVTITDLTDIYMTIFLPARDAGLLQMGDEARIILDPIPNYVIPAAVTFVSSSAQFTPKSVETTEERDKLMFRVKLQLPKDLLVKFQDRVKAGVAGIGYVRSDPSVEWPPELDVALPK